MNLSRRLPTSARKGNSEGQAALASMRIERGVVPFDDRRVSDAEVVGGEGVVPDRGVGFEEFGDVCIVFEDRILARLNSELNKLLWRRAKFGDLGGADIVKESIAIARIVQPDRDSFQLARNVIVRAHKALPLRRDVDDGVERAAVGQANHTQLPEFIDRGALKKRRAARLELSGNFSASASVDPRSRTLSGVTPN